MLPFWSLQCLAYCFGECSVTVKWRNEFYCFPAAVWSRQWHPTPALLPGKSHGWRSLIGCSPWGRYELDTTERLHFHFSLSCIGEGNGNPLQCSCLENPRDGGAWWAAVYGVAQSWTWLTWLNSSSSGIPEWSSGFLHFLQFQSEFGNKEFMIRATVSSWSCFCWLYRASPSLAAKIYDQSDFCMDHLWCSYVAFSCVVGEGCLLWPVRSLGKTVLPFPLLNFVLQGKISPLLHKSLDFVLLHSSPL